MSRTSSVSEEEDKHIYIVDDDAGVRRSTSFLLKIAGFQPRTFRSGIDFLEALTELRPGVVLLDIRMPQIDGISLLEQLPPDARWSFPVIMMTGHGDLQTAVRAMKSGAREFLEKPFDELILFKVLNKAIDELQSALTEKSHRRRCRNPLEKLSLQELEVLQALAKGKPNKVVAHQLGLSVRTVEMHRTNLMDRLGVRTLAEAIKTAVGTGTPF